MHRWICVLAACLGLSALIGCSPAEPSFSVVLLDSVSSRTEAEVDDAVADWEAKAPGLHLHVSREHAWEENRANTIWVSEVANLPDDVFGRSTREGASWTSWIDIKVTAMDATTVRHEIGHALGLSHAPGGVMVAGGEVGRVATTVQTCDVEQYRRVWNM